MNEDFRRIMDDAIAKLSPLAPPGTTLGVDETPLLVTRHAAYLPISNEHLMEYGLIPDTRPPVKIGWRTRFRWWRSSKREQFGRWVGSKIAGVDLSERDDW